MYEQVSVNFADEVIIFGKKKDEPHMQDETLVI